jgi:electron transport complex protein RnfD
VSNTFEGTLSSKSGSHGVKDRVEIFAPQTDIEYYVTYGDDKTGICSMYNRAALEGKDHYTVFFGGNYSRVDITTTATPLEQLAKGESQNLLDLFLGLHGGAIGETCILALILGFVYLLVRKVITWHTPVVFIATVFVLYLAFTGDVVMALSQILAGGLFIGAIFMATDYVTTPITTRGRIVFALGCGVITFIIRYFCAYPEGVSFSILIMNILTPFIEKWTAKEPLGGVK